MSREANRVETQQRIVKFVVYANWGLFGLLNIIGWFFAPADFARGILFGGLIVTVNFHLLAKTLKKALTPPHLASRNAILAKYYIRFIASGVILFILIYNHLVNPVGLIIGLSIVVASLMMATVREITKLFFKEAV